MDIVFLGEAVAQSIANAIKSLTNGKVDKVSGKGLSTNDYTTAEKNKLAGISEGANKTTVDTALSSTSTNPVQNKVISTALDPVTVNSADANTYIGRNLTQFGNQWVNGPVASITGWLINYTHGTASAKNQYNTQLFIQLHSQNIYIRNHDNYTFEPWYKLPLRSEITQLQTDTATALGAIKHAQTTVAGDILEWALGVKGFDTIKTNPNTTNLPSGRYYGLALAETFHDDNDNNIWIRLFFFPTSSNDIYVNSKTNAGDWLGWQMLPNRTEFTNLSSDVEISMRVFPNISSNTEYKTILDYVKYLANHADSRGGYFFAQGSVTDLPVASQPVFVSYYSDSRVSGQIYIETISYTNASIKHITIINRTNSTSITWTAVPTNADTIMYRSHITTAPTSDTEILSWKPGVYSFSLSEASPYVPYQWGDLMLMHGSNFSAALWISADPSACYYRSGHKTYSRWYTEWTRLAEQSSVDALCRASFASNFAASSMASFTINQVGVGSGWATLAMKFTVTKAMAGYTNDQITFSSAYAPSSSINLMASTAINSGTETLQWQVMASNCIRCERAFAVGDVVKVQLTWPFKK